MFNDFALVLLEQARDMQPTQTMPQQAVLKDQHGQHEAACSAIAFEPICVAFSARRSQEHRGVTDLLPGCLRHIMTNAHVEESRHGCYRTQHPLLCPNTGQQ